MKILRLASLALWLPGLAGAADLLLKNAQLLDPATRTVRATDILIRDLRIAPEVTAPAGEAQVVDLAGRWVIPGLIDLHVHQAGNPRPDGGFEAMPLADTARRFLYCGVTAVLNLGSLDPTEFFALRDRQRADPTAASDLADLYGAGTPFGWWTQSSPETAAARVEAHLRQWRPDVIKVILGSTHRAPGNQAILEAIVKVARRSGVKTVVHINAWADARAALAAGAAALTHLDDDNLIPDDLPARWARSGAWSIPTMAVQCDMATLARAPGLLDAPLLVAVAAPATRQAYRENQRYEHRVLGIINWQLMGRERDFAAVRLLAAAGIPLLAGSDPGNLGVFQGWSLHREIKLLQAAGLPAWDALAAATTRAADFLGRPHGIAPGDLAELVVLDANPLEDLANTEKISYVVHHGRLMDREALRAKFGRE